MLYNTRAINLPCIFEMKHLQFSMRPSVSETKFCYMFYLIHEQLETIHGCILSTVATDQYPQCCPNIHCTGPVWYRNITLIRNSIRQSYYILQNKRNTQLFKCSYEKLKTKPDPVACGGCNGFHDTQPSIVQYQLLQISKDNIKFLLARKILLFQVQLMCCVAKRTRSLVKALVLSKQFMSK